MIVRDLVFRILKANIKGRIIIKNKNWLLRIASLKRKLMALIQWRPWLGRSWDDLDDWFEDKALSARSSQFMPPVDIYEKGNKVIVETQVTGIDPEKVDISVEENHLIIKGASQRKTEVDEKNYYRKEVYAGSFYRSVPLPVKVIGDKAEAIYEDGLLKVSIPKMPETKAKKISIKVKTAKK